MTEKENQRDDTEMKVKNDYYALERDDYEYEISRPLAFYDAAMVEQIRIYHDKLINEIDPRSTDNGYRENAILLSDNLIHPDAKIQEFLETARPILVENHEWMVPYSDQKVTEILKEKGWTQEDVIYAMAAASPGTNYFHREADRDFAAKIVKEVFKHESMIIEQPTSNLSSGSLPIPKSSMSQAIKDDANQLLQQLEKTKGKTKEKTKDNSKNGPSMSGMGM